MFDAAVGAIAHRTRDGDEIDVATGRRIDVTAGPRAGRVGPAAGAVRAARSRPAPVRVVSAPRRVPSPPPVPAPGPPPVPLPPFCWPACVPAARERRGA